MGLTKVLAASAVRGAHVLVVEVPGSWPLRALMERAVLERGWRLAAAAADADVLAVCGHPGPQCAEAVETVWDQLPGPRVRIEVETEAETISALDRAARELSDTPTHQQDARQRSVSPVVTTAHAQMDMSMDMPMDMDMDMDMEMAPEGIPLAAGGDDRDGLEMDVLHLRLGPLLRYWPAGLVLRCTLHGDVISGAQTEVIDVVTQAASPVLRSAWLCDNITTVVALTGWEDAAAQARRVRDSLVTGQDLDRAAAALDSLARRIRRSRLLRWSLRDIGVLTVDEARQLHLSSDQAGDAWDRLLIMLEHAGGEPSAGKGVSAVPVNAVAAVPGLVEGLDLAAARLIVASLGLAPFAARDMDAHG